MPIDPVSLGIYTGTNLLGSFLGSGDSWSDKKKKQLYEQIGGLQPPDFSQYNLNRPELERLYGNYFNQGQSNLSGAMSRAGSGAGINAFSQGQSMGLNNPFSLQQRARTSTMSQFAPQFGELEGKRLGLMAQLPQMVSGFNREGQQMNWQSLMQKFGLMGNLAGGQQEGSSFGQNFAGGLPGLAQILSAMMKT
jgi:hypothetical protein